MRAVQADYGYTIQPAGDGYVIAYQQKPRLWQMTLATLLVIAPIGILLTFIVILTVSPANAARPSLHFALLLSTISLSVVCGRAIVRAIASRRTGATISISPQFLEANGKRYERSHITQLYVRGPNEAHNPNPAIANSSGIVAFGASGALGVGGVAAAGLQAGADGIRNSVGMVSHGVLGMFNIWSRSRGWSIWVNYGAKPARIAQRLEASHAELLLQDLGRLLTAR